MTHWCIQHRLRYFAASQSPVSLQSVSKVTVFSTVRCTRPRSPASLAPGLRDALLSAVAVSAFRNATPCLHVSFAEKENQDRLFFYVCAAALGLLVESVFLYIYVSWNSKRSFAWLFSVCSASPACPPTLLRRPRVLRFSRAAGVRRSCCPAPAVPWFPRLPGVIGGVGVAAFWPIPLTRPPLGLFGAAPPLRLVRCASSDSGVERLEANPGSAPLSS